MPTDVSGPLPELTLEEKAVLTIDTGDPAAIITRLVIHFRQQVPDDFPPISLVPPVLVREAPGRTR